MYFRQVFDEKLAQYAYLVGCQQTNEALLIDPERDIDRYLRLARADGLEIVATAETHIHADFLSGCREFAVRYGTRTFLPGHTPPDWEYAWIRDPEFAGRVVRLMDGDVFRIGNIEIRAVHNPGHTPEHTSYLITDRGAGADEPIGLASGDFVFVGDLGRPDLLESAAGVAGVAGVMRPFARQLYRSAVRFLEQPDYLQVWPGHGAGSACGKALGAIPGTTVGYERRFSPAIAAAMKGEEPFVDWILDGQPEPPPYFARMKTLNRDGPPLLGAVPEPARTPVADIAAAALREDCVVIDARRDRLDFLRGHLPGSLCAPLNKAFPTIVGSWVSPDQEIRLIAAPEDIEECVLNLIRIGYDRVLGYATDGDLAEYADGGGELRAIPVIDFAALRRRIETDDVRVLDVRYAAESATAGRVPGAQNIAHTRLRLRMDELPKDRPLLVYCEAGARSGSAVSLLRKHGYDVVAVEDDIANWNALEAAGAAD
jgi:hydroxyacylglutathione hydrolase